MATRLIWLAHGATTGMREMIFGDQTPLAAPADVEPWTERVHGWRCGPELACVETARALGVEATVDPALAGPDAGTWTGRDLATVMEADPAAVGAWVSDASVSPPGGESLATLLGRVGAWMDDLDAPDGASGLVVSPLVAKAAAVHALGASPDALFRLDLAPLERVVTSRQGDHWRLRRLG